MHIHQSVVDKETGRNILSDEESETTTEFLSFIAGHQEFLPAVTCITAPYVNSYRRFMRRNSTAPCNVFWGHDNRIVGLRVPNSKASARRLENLVPESDANPYLTIAASLACGWLGMKNDLRPDAPRTGYSSNGHFTLPRGLTEALTLFEQCDELMEVFGERFRRHLPRHQAGIVRNLHERGQRMGA